MSSSTAKIFQALRKKIMGYKCLDLLVAQSKGSLPKFNLYCRHHYCISVGYLNILTFNTQYCEHSPWKTT